MNNSAKRLSAITLILTSGVILWTVYSPDQKVAEENRSEQHHQQHASSTEIERLAPASIDPTSSIATSSGENRSAVGDGVAEPWVGEAFAPSLAGTEIDGDLRADKQGNLVTSVDIKDFFDYFFSAVGERSAEDVIAEIERQIKQRLPETASAQAMQLMRDYIAYQEQMGSLMQQPLVPADQQDYQYYASTMAATFDQLKQLRRQFFSPDIVDTFFGLEEAYGEYAVRTLQIQADPNLADEEKIEQISALESLLPEQMITADRIARARAASADKARRLFEAGESPDRIREVLREQFDEAAANSIVSFYENEKKWQQRMDSFLLEKRSVTASSMSGEDQEKALDTLRRKLFSDDELTRVTSEEAILRKLEAPLEES
jgi:lipase chaperone LimK